ncbi:MAG TPA: phosphoadenylyl-sulfate reductase [Stellaceae bacterium]|jgi:phosphoadenosine phosphosulfate reductase|nr:phosphoadenylyl-sulfate reductase [Stellaceae bacterium]
MMLDVEETYPHAAAIIEPDDAGRDIAGAATIVAEMTRRYGGFDGAALLRPLIEREFAGRLAVVSSFGTEAAVILAHVAEIDRNTPILFLDTGRLFGETLRYRDQLVAFLGLRDVRTICPDAGRLMATDPDNTLWLNDPDACCTLRKTEPLDHALTGFAAWVSGRKRYHGGTRSALSLFEQDACSRLKINPLAGWSKTRIDAEFAARGLPRHPLEAEGYLSVGCLTCTDRVSPGEELRAGRWRHSSKTECGIHHIPTRCGYGRDRP